MPAPHPKPSLNPNPNPKPAEPAPDLLTADQAAAVLQLSVSSIRAYIRQGKLKAFRVAGLRKVLIARDDLMKLLEPAREEDLSPRQE